MSDSLGDLFTLFTPRPALTVSTYADEHRWLSKEANFAGGKYSSAYAPYQREPMDSSQADVQRIVLMWASQTGKTETINNIVAYFIDWDPSPMLVLQPTLDMAETWSKDRLAPMVRDSPRLKPLIARTRSRSSGNTILHKSFPGGHVTSAGANSPASLASRPVRVLLLDEVDRYPDSAGAEGDPISLAIKRTDTFSDAVIFETSTPTVKGASKIEADFQLSDQRYYFVPCPHCGFFQTFKWANVQWPEGHTELAVLVCENPECKQTITDAQRLKMVLDPRSHWRATARFNGIIGYHLNGLYSPFRTKRGYKTRLHQAAAQFLEAKHRGRLALMVWVNTFLAETFEDVGDRIEQTDLLRRRENYGPALPGEALLLTLSVDVQGDRLEAEVTAWGDQYESWGVQYLILPGSPLQPQVWRDLDALLEQTWKTADGRMLNLVCTTIDSSYSTDEVLAYTKPRFGRRVYAVRGSNIASQPLIGTLSRNNRRRAPVYRVGTDTAKNMIHGRLKLEDPGPGYMHFPRGDSFGFDATYFSGLTAEEPRTVYVKGMPRRVWVRIRPRNEPLDLRVYACAAVAILQPDWSVLTRKLPISRSTTYTLKQEAPPSGDPEPKTVKNKTTPPPPLSKPAAARRRSFTRSWRKF